MFAKAIKPQYVTNCSAEENLQLAVENEIFFYFFFYHSLITISHDISGHLKFYLDTLVHTSTISTFFILTLYFVVYRVHPDATVNFVPYTSLLRLQTQQMHQQVLSFRPSRRMSQF